MANTSNPRICIPRVLPNAEAVAAARRAAYLEGVTAAAERLAAACMGMLGGDSESDSDSD